jgi:hypothetical protein
MSGLPGSEATPIPNFEPLNSQVCDADDRDTAIVCTIVDDAGYGNRVRFFNDGMRWDPTTLCPLTSKECCSATR